MTNKSSTIIRLDRSHRFIVPVLLILSAVLAVTSLVGDSITYDEISHLTSGMSYLLTGDFRLGPEHPPLAKMWVAWPNLLTEQKWPSPYSKQWQKGYVWQVGRTWFYDLIDGEHLLILSRCMMVILLSATCVCIYAIGRRLFGPGAGLLALLLAALSPTLLAHGRLVTTDLPATLCMLLILITFARLVDCITWPRILIFSVTLSASSLTKFSWPLIIPALAIMAIIAVCRNKPFICPLLGKTFKQKDIKSRRQRLFIMAGIWIVAAAIVWLSIWTCYGWQFSPFRGSDRDKAMMMAVSAPGKPYPADMGQAWQSVLRDSDGKLLKGPVPAFVRWGRNYRLLPEAYLYGIAFTNKTTRTRSAYLNGRISNTGFLAYFPTAFAIKTPVAVMLLFLAGVVVLIMNFKKLVRDYPLFIGLAAFAVLYALFAVTANINIGHRHILPVYPLLFVVAGASAVWLKARPGRWLIGMAVVWLAAVNIWIHPHYLSYFNELIGGPTNPTRYGFECQMLPSSWNFGKPADLSAGTYAISVTRLLGVYYPMARDSFWNNPTNKRSYKLLTDILAGTATSQPSNLTPQQKTQLNRQYGLLAKAKVINQLRHREPDERVGYSLFIYRLTQSDVDALVKP